MKGFVRRLGLADLWTGLRRRPLALVLSALVTVGCLWLLHRGALPVVPSRDLLALASPWAVPAYALSLSIVLLLRALRWHFLIRPLTAIPLREVVASNLVFFGGVFVLPLRLGEVIRPALLRRPGRLSGWQVFGLVGAERVVDGLVSSIILAAALFLPSHEIPQDSETARVVRSTAAVMVALFGSALGVVIAFFLFRRQARRLIEVAFGWVSRPMAQLLADKVEAIAQGLEFLRVPSAGVPFLLGSLVYWAANVGSAWLLLVACGVDASWVHAGALIGALALGLLVPGAPGFFGTFQMSAYAGLAVYLSEDVVASRGAVVVFWMYVVQVVVTLLLSVAALPSSLRHAAEPEQSEPLVRN